MTNNILDLVQTVNNSPSETRTTTRKDTSSAGQKNEFAQCLDRQRCAGEKEKGHPKTDRPETINEGNVEKDKKTEESPFISLNLPFLDLTKTPEASKILQEAFESLGIDVSISKSGRQDHPVFQVRSEEPQNLNPFTITDNPQAPSILDTKPSSDSQVFGQFPGPAFIDFRDILASIQSVEPVEQPEEAVDIPDENAEPMDITLPSILQQDPDMEQKPSGLNADGESAVDLKGAANQKQKTGNGVAFSNEKHDLNIDDKSMHLKVEIKQPIEPDPGVKNVSEMLNSTAGNKVNVAAEMDSGKIREVEKNGSEKVIFSPENRESEALEVSRAVFETVTVKKPEVVNEIARVVRDYAADNRGQSKTLEIALDPPNLGKISVSLKIDEGVLHSSFTCTNRNINIIRDAIPELKAMLSGSGINLGESSINLGGGNLQESGNRNSSENNKKNWKKPESIQEISSGQNVMDSQIDSKYSFVI